MRKILRSLAVLTLAAGGLAVTSGASAAPPENVSEEPVVFGPDFTFCQYDITAVLDGKSKTIEKKGFTILTSPGLKITLSANGKTETFVATGSFKVTTLANGNVLTEFRGNNLVSDPMVGFLAISGHFTFLTDSAGNILQNLQGNGRTTDICAALAP